MSIKIVKNLRENDPVIYAGMSIPADSSYSIPESELEDFRNSDKLFADLNSSPPLAAITTDANPEQEIVGPDGVKLLLDHSDEPTVNAPFSSKKIEGKSLYRRKHGLVKDCPNGETTFEFIVPYNNVKINEVEFLNCDLGDTVDLFVHDTPDGLIQQSMGVPPGSITPSLMLNQFGFDTAVPNGFYKDVSSYDADLIKDMKVRAVYKRNGVATIKNGMNIVFHELK